MKQVKMKNAALPSLPEEILLQILQLLDIPALKCLRPTCRRLNSVGSTLLFRSVALRVKNHHASGCSDYEAEAHKNKKLTNNSRPTPGETSFPHVLHLLPRAVLIASKRPEDTHKCQKAGCKLDLRAFKRALSASLLANLKSIKRSDVDLDYRFLSASEIAIVNNAIRGFAEGADIRVRFRNISVNAELFVAGFDNLPVERLHALDVSFRDSKTALVDKSKEKLLNSLGSILNRGRVQLKYLKLEAWNRLRNGAIDLDIILSKAGDGRLPLETLELDGVSAANLSPKNTLKLHKLRKLLLRGTITAGILSKLAEYKHPLTLLTVDNIRDEFFEYVGTNPALTQVHIFRTESHRASDDAMAARVWTEAYPLFRNTVKKFSMYSCRMTETRPSTAQYIAAYELGRQTTSLPSSVITASPTLKKLAVCVSVGRRFDHAVKDLLSNSPRLKTVDFCFHVNGKRAVDGVMIVMRRMLKTVVPIQKAMVVECLFSDPHSNRGVGTPEEGFSYRCAKFSYEKGWREEWVKME